MTLRTFLRQSRSLKKKEEKIDHIIVNDDVSIEDDASLIKEDAASLVLFSFKKILGAAALEGHSLEELTTLGHSITKNLHTLGVALSPVNDPVKGKSFIHIK